MSSLVRLIVLYGYEQPGQAHEQPVLYGYGYEQPGQAHSAVRL